MANTITLTALTELLYQSRDIVAREPSGFIQSVTVNKGSEGVSIGGTVTSHVTAQPTLNTDHTPAMTVPAGDDSTIAADTMTIGQIARTNIPIKGEVAKQLANIGRYGDVIKDLFAQHIRTQVNAIESHCGTVIKNGSSRAVGIAGTTPFSSSHALIPQCNQILTDNGAPADGRRALVLSTGASTNLKMLSHIYKVNEAGNDSVIRRGMLMDIDGVGIRQSAGVAAHTAGTGAGYLINAGTVAIGTTGLTIDTGTGTVLPGDTFTLASDANVYVNKTSITTGATTLTLNKPGLRLATADNRAVTLAASYTGNVLFHPNAVELVMRPPSMPEGGDAAVERVTLYDEVTGLVFEVAIYRGYGMNYMEFVTYYQAKVWKPEFVASLLG